MLSIFNFTNTDYLQVKKIPKSLLVYFLLFIVICIPVSLIFGFVGNLKNGLGYWLTFSILLSTFFIITLYLALRDYFLFKKDIKIQHKYSGIVRITEITSKKSQIKISIDSIQVKSFTLNKAEISTSLKVGDEVYIEISKYSKTLFQLKKDDRDLLIRENSNGR